MSQVILKDLSLYYGENKKNLNCVLNNLNLTFHEQKINVIIGPSGAGKTSILKCISGALVYNGSIYFNNDCIDNLPIYKRGLGYLSQEFVLYPMYNVYDNIMYALKNKKIDFEKADMKVKQIANDLGLTYLLTRRIKQLSIGQASKVALAKALLSSEDVLLLDEPFASLDLLNKQFLIKYIKEYAQKNHLTIILVTHDIKSILSIGDYYYLFEEGKLHGEYDSQSILKSQNPLLRAIFMEENYEKKKN